VSLKSQITRRGYIDPETVTVLPIGISDTGARKSSNAHERLVQKHGLPHDSIIAVTVGRFVEQKGHRYLIEAIPELVRLTPQLRFLFCGDGPLETDIRARAASLGIGEHIVFAGMLKSVEEEIAGADFMIHPSIEEPFGIGILEGMRAGLPVIASNVGGIPEVMGDCGVLIEHRNPTAIVDAVARLLVRPDHAMELGIKARARFEENFLLNTMIDRIQDYLTEIVQTEKRHG
jgi:glycosyltransferase involved in cell wall biosynthesis